LTDVAAGVRLAAVGCSMRRKPIIGILGGIASGKSTVAAQLARLGCNVIDADDIAHRLLDEASVRDEVVALFGDAILDSEKRIDRQELAKIVFADADKLSSLNKIIHPLVLRKTEELIEQYNKQSFVKAIVLDMPLLVEVGWANRCDKLVFVDCRAQLRADRARKMGFFDENQVNSRENFQISLDKKAGLADNTVDNNSGFSALVRQVTDIFSHIVGNG
jgi:dephospho-CoA kinase